MKTDLQPFRVIVLFVLQVCACLWRVWMRVNKAGPENRARVCLDMTAVPKPKWHYKALIRL